LYFRGFYLLEQRSRQQDAWDCELLSPRCLHEPQSLGVENFEAITIRHSNSRRNDFAHEAAPALTTFANSSPAPFVAGITAARQRIVARTDEDRGAF